MKSVAFGLNLASAESDSVIEVKPATLAFFSFSCDGGCQQAIGSMIGLEDMLAMVEPIYWPMFFDGDVPQECDVAIVEGAAFSQHALDSLARIRETSAIVIAVGACATCGGLLERLEPLHEGMLEHPVPAGVAAKVDFEVPGCPVDPREFNDVLQKALLGCKQAKNRPTLCGECKLTQHVCLLEEGKPCLGMVTPTGCGARCIDAGDTCTACRGIAPDASLPAARVAAKRCGYPSEDLDRRLSLFNLSALCKDGDADAAK